MDKEEGGGGGELSPSSVPEEEKYGWNPMVQVFPFCAYMAEGKGV